MENVPDGCRLRIVVHDLLKGFICDGYRLVINQWEIVRNPVNKTVSCFISVQFAMTGYPQDLDRNLLFQAFLYNIPNTNMASPFVSQVLERINAALWVGEPADCSSHVYGKSQNIKTCLTAYTALSKDQATTPVGRDRSVFPSGPTIRKLTYYYVLVPSLLIWGLRTVFTLVLGKKRATVGEFQLVELISETRPSQREEPSWL